MAGLHEFRKKNGIFGRNGTKVVLFFIFACIPVFLSPACSRSPLLIGFVGPLTGSSSAIGLGGRNGFLLALGDGPGAAAGKTAQLSLVVKDDHGDPDACLAAFQELRKAGCRVVVLGTTSNAALKAIPWAMRNGILVLSPTVSSVKITGAENLFVRVNTASEEYGIKLAQLSYGRYGKKRVGVIGDERNESYTKAVYNAFSAEYTRLGGTVSFTIFFDSLKRQPAVGLSDAVRKNRSDGVFMIASSTDVVLMAKELEKNGQRVQVFLPPWPLTLDLLQNGGKAMEGAVAISIADLEFRTPAGKAFEAAYKAEFGEAPSFTAMFAYETASILRSTLSTAPGAGPAELRQRIIAAREFKGLQGTIRFNENAEAERDMLLFTIKNGTFERID